MIRHVAYSDPFTAIFRPRDELDVITNIVVDLLDLRKEEAALSFLGSTQLGDRYWKVIDVIAKRRIWAIGTRILQRITDKDSKLNKFISFAIKAVLYDEHIIVEMLHTLTPPENRDYFARFIANYCLAIFQVSNSVRYLKLIENKETRVEWLLLSYNDLNQEIYRYKLMSEVLMYYVSIAKLEDICLIKERMPFLDLDLLFKHLVDFYIDQKDFATVKDLLPYLKSEDASKVRSNLYSSFDISERA